MRSTTSLCKDTPSVAVRDNRGLTVRNVEYNRVTEGGERQIYITRHVFDASGELQSSADPVRALQPTATPNFHYRRTLSGLPIRTESIDAGTQVQLQDARGLLIWAADSNKNRQRWEYDALGRPTRCFEQASDDMEESCRERFFYGDADSEAGQNLRGCLIRHDDTAGCVQISSYALTGKPLNEARRFLSSLDKPNWPEDEEASEALLEEYSHTTHRTYNALSELLTETDAAGHRRRYEQNFAGQTKAVWLKLAGQAERPIASNLQYNAWGATLQIRIGNGVVRTYEYEATTQRLQRLNALRESDSTALQNLRYTYDPVGNITRIEDIAQPTRYTRNQRVDPVAIYEYDACYQLLSATGRESEQAPRQGIALPPWQKFDNTQLVNYTRRYTYDAGGNLCKIQHTAEKQNYSLGMTVSAYSNRIVPEEWEATPEQVDSYFDLNGNLKQLQPGQPLTWNGRNQLSRVVQIDRPSNADDERYIYASESQRVRKVRRWLAGNQQHTEEVRYLPGLELREQRQADVSKEGEGDARVNERLQMLSMAVGGMSLRLLHWEVGQPEDITNDQARYSLDNHLGSSTLELDGQAHKLTYEEYYPYGGTAIWTAKSQIEAKYKYVRYSGKERDATGLYYYGYRYYAPWLGRWLNPDPALAIDGLNLYRMVRNNPVLFKDADGLVPETGKFQIDIGIKEKALLRLKAAQTKIKVFDSSKNKFVSSNKFKLVEVNDIKSGFLLGGEEFVNHLDKYNKKYDHYEGSRDLPDKMAENISLGEDISRYMLRSARDHFADQGHYSSVDNHPSFSSETRFFALMRKEDKDKIPDNREIYGMAELKTYTDSKTSKTEVIVNYALAHPETQLHNSAYQKADPNMPAHTAANDQFNIKGVGTFLTIKSLKRLSKKLNITKVQTDAINVRSAAIAKRFGAKSHAA